MRSDYDWRFSPFLNPGRSPDAMDLRCGCAGWFSSGGRGTLHDTRGACAEFGLPSPPWMSYTSAAKMRPFIRHLFPAAIASALVGCSSMPTASDAPATPLERYQWATKELKSTRNEEDRWLALGEAAKAAVWIGHVGEARQYADELKALTPNYQGNWNYGNAIHDYNLVLGSIALGSGDIAGSKGFLLAAGRTPGSPQLNSFGPNMSLAKALLIAGERKTVMVYLDLCRDFWPREELSTWRKELETGNIPDFGANLVY